MRNKKKVLLNLYNQKNKQTKNQRRVIRRLMACKKSQSLAQFLNLSLVQGIIKYFGYFWI